MELSEIDFDPSDKEAVLYAINYFKDSAGNDMSCNVKNAIIELLNKPPKDKDSAIETYRKLESLLSAWVIADIPTNEKKTVLNAIW